MKVAILLVLLACSYLAAAGTLVHTPLPVYEARYSIRGPKRLVFSPTICGNEVDVHLRYRYWYYLPNAQLIYVTHITDSYGFLYIHQYRNLLGTFYAIVRYGTPSRKISVVSFCRLGEGYAVKGSYSYTPFYVKPFVISMNLGFGDYHVPRWTEVEQPTWSWTWARSRFYKKVSVANFADTQCAMFDKYARKNYWYYLDGATTTSSSNSLFGKYCYCCLTYANRVGTWQVIGYYGPSGSVVSTFVRLGDGYEPKLVKMLKPYPAFTTWHFE